MAYKVCIVCSRVYHNKEDFEALPFIDWIPFGNYVLETRFCRCGKVIGKEHNPKEG